MNSAGRGNSVMDPFGRKLAATSLLALALLLMLNAVAGCTARIVPPATVHQPATVYLLDHGRTPSLVLPTDDGRMVRYAYGDWRYYALRKNDFFHGVAALLWPTQGALGRRELPGPPTLESVRQQVAVGCENVYAIDVEQSKATELREKLDALFESNRGTLVFNEPYDLEFVHHPRSYTLLHDSNRAVAAWLRELGCDVDGRTPLSKWRVAER